MKTVTVESIPELMPWVEKGAAWANGKNFPVDHLHETIAESRWPYENIHGIYLTNESHIWMALWMAISRRGSLSKRHIRYFAPTSADPLGQVEVYSSDMASCLGKKGYLYLFNPVLYLATGRLVDIRDVPKSEKVDALLDEKFEWANMVRHGKTQAALLDKTREPGVVLVDEWQIALTNTPRAIPDTEIIIEQLAIKGLVGKVALSKTEVGEEYIVR